MTTVELAAKLAPMARLAKGERASTPARMAGFHATNSVSMYGPILKTAVVAALPAVLE